MKPEIAAVIVTNNRLELLKESVQAIRQQTLEPQYLIVINNGSTDGTTEWLDQQQGLSVVHQENSGGSGGFYTGIKEAAALGADWIWLMDDDTICHDHTLERLAEKLYIPMPAVGFIGSKCIWKDGSPHFMNIPAIKPRFNNKIPFNNFDGYQLLLIETCSFVSLLINTKAVREVGLPYKEFFIWGDDQEYTRRITKKGYLGMYCSESTVLHKTPINYFPDFYHDTPNNIWKHSYGFRNEFFMVKKNKGFPYFICWLVIKVAYTSFRILSIRKSNDSFRFIGVVLQSAWKSIFFNPKINYI